MPPTWTGDVTRRSGRTRFPTPTTSSALDVLPGTTLRLSETGWRLACTKAGRPRPCLRLGSSVNEEAGGQARSTPFNPVKFGQTVVPQPSPLRFRRRRDPQTTLCGVREQDPELWEVPKGGVKEDGDGERVTTETRTRLTGTRRERQPRSRPSPMRTSSNRLQVPSVGSMSGISRLTRRWFPAPSCTESYPCGWRLAESMCQVQHCSTLSRTLYYSLGPDGAKRRVTETSVETPSSGGRCQK